jgi:hypothetical protein
MPTPVDSLSNTPSNTPLTSITDILFAYAYPVSFVGALFLCTTQILSIQLDTVFSYQFSSFLYIFIGISGFVSVFNWFNMDVPLIGSSIINKNAIKLKL